MHCRFFAGARLAWISAALVALSLTAAAAQSLDDVLAKYYAARGGADKWKAATTLTMTGKMLMGPMEAPFTMHMKRPNKMRADFEVMGMTGTQAFDGETAWMRMPFMGKKDPEPMSTDQAKEVKQRADFDGPLFNWKAKGHAVELAGQEKMEGTDAWKIRVTMPDSSTQVIYLDADSYLEIKIAAKRTMNGNEMEVEEYPGDYKDVNGLIVPMSIETKIKGMDESQKMVFASATINDELADSLFTMPAIAKATDATVGAPESKDAAQEAKDAPLPADKKPGAKKKP